LAAEERGDGRVVRDRRQLGASRDGKTPWAPGARRMHQQVFDPIQRLA
jgi:hypothetical protein